MFVLDFGGSSLLLTVSGKRRIREKEKSADRLIWNSHQLS